MYLRFEIVIESSIQTSFETSNIFVFGQFRVEIEFKSETMQSKLDPNSNTPWFHYELDLFASLGAASGVHGLSLDLKFGPN